MSIYVYNTVSGNLFSYIPDSITIAQAQASNQLASNAQLTAGGNTAVDSLPAIDSTHQWSAASKTVITVTAPTAVKQIPLLNWIFRFTALELQAVRASPDPGVQQFLYLCSLAQGQIIDLNQAFVISAVANMVTLNLLTQARANVIMT